MDSSTGSSTLLILSLFSVLFSTEFLLCASQTYLDCFESDRKALLDFKTTLLDPSNHLTSWRGLACCAWRGVRCDNRTGLIIHINLRGLGLSSSMHEFASSLPRLTGLRRLDLSSNSFEADPIPQSICSSQNLRYLNLSNSGFGGRLPPQLGNLSRLRFFDVSSPGLSAEDLSWVSNLSSLKTLSMNGVDLSRVDSDWVRHLNKLSSLVELQLSGCSLPSIAPFLHNSINFTSLANIDLSFNAFSASTILGWISNITSLEHIDISNNNMRGSVPLQLPELPHLKYLSLAGNHNLTSNISELLSGRWSHIETLAVADNQVFGEIPPSIGNITSLVELDFFSNHIEGGIPSSIGKLCKLKYLNLAGNNLSLQLPESLERSNGCNSTHILPNLESLMLSVNGIQGTLPKWLGELKRLVVLDVTSNSIQGPIPESLSKLSRLTNLGLRSNALNGSLPPSLGELSNLVYLDISSNQLSGFLSEAHFSKLSKLKILIASSNSLLMNVSSDWVPPFRLRNLDMGSIRLGPSFPPWLETQKSELMFLDLSNTSINDEMPSWFWDQLSSNLSLLNISFNQIRGELPNPLKVPAFADVSMKSNLFEGPLPNLSNGVELLDLSDNRFFGSIPPDIGKVSPYLIFLSLSGNSLSGLIPPSSIGEMQSLQVLDLSNNNLTGPIPTNLYNCSFLEALDLGHNNLTGTIPSSIGLLNQLQTLHLQHNRLSQTIPRSLRNCENLETIDLGSNTLTGEIPIWVGERLKRLRILSLRSNSFSGDIPEGLCNLTSLQVLDLSGNRLTGPIPRSLNGLIAMSRPRAPHRDLFYGSYRGRYYEESLSMQVKGGTRTYTKILSLVISIDVSHNAMSGEIPEELMSLKGMVVLNLSGNGFRGGLSNKVGDLAELSSLDVSENAVSGPIPPSIARLGSLGYLNLSYNNFSGEVPYEGQVATFEADAFLGNPFLCGPPLARRCHVDGGEGGIGVGDGGGSSTAERGLFLSVGSGFAAGLIVPFVVMSIRRPWSAAYFGFIDWVVKKMYCVRDVVGSRGVRRRRRGRRGTGL